MPRLHAAFALLAARPARAACRGVAAGVGGLLLACAPAIALAQGGVEIFKDADLALGAKLMAEWTVLRVDGDALDSLAGNG